MQQKVGRLATFYFSHVEEKVRLRCVQGAALNWQLFYKEWGRLWGWRIVHVTCTLLDRDCYRKLSFTSLWRPPCFNIYSSWEGNVNRFTHKYPCKPYCVAILKCVKGWRNGGPLWTVWLGTLDADWSLEMVSLETLVDGLPFTLVSLISWGVFCGAVAYFISFLNMLKMNAEFWAASFTSFVWLEGLDAGNLG